MDRPATSAEGSLFELVARGKKDVYFLSQEKTANVPFSYNMTTWPATIDETRLTQSFNTTDFGRYVEWEMDAFGDLLISASLIVELPTWLPPDIAALNSKSVISDSSGNRYGYTQGVGAFIFEQIQFYQDQLLLQEFSGDFLYAWTHFNGTLNQESLALNELGGHRGSPLEIQRNASPGKLILRLPLIGCAHPEEGGLPFVALPGQKYRIRCKLRRLEELVEDSAGNIKPSPWSRKDLSVRDINGIVKQFLPIQREKIGKPVITLETTQRYVRQDIQAIIKKTPIQIPFLRPFENKLSLDPSDYVSVGNGGTSYITKRMDGRHPAEGILIFFQSAYTLERNQLWNFNNPLESSGGTYYNTLKFLVAGKEREMGWDSNLWNNISPWVKCEKTSGIPVTWIPFSVGPSYGYRAPQKRKPSGTLNFTMADRPTLWMDIKDTLQGMTKQKRVVMRAISIGWGIYTIGDERGTLVFGN
jgi:hypothetical protein